MPGQQPRCGGSEQPSAFCAGHTVLAHDGHLGVLADGKLHCYRGGEPVACSLSMEASSCAFVALKDHLHGPDCGHERVPHGDHWDYLVDGRLHHVVQALDSMHNPSCCMRKCLGELLELQVVDHGEVQVVRERDPNACQAMAAQRAHSAPLPPVAATHGHAHEHSQHGQCGHAHAHHTHSLSEAGDHSHSHRHSAQLETEHGHAACNHDHSNDHHHGSHARDLPAPPSPAHTPAGAPCGGTGASNTVHSHKHSESCCSGRAPSAAAAHRAGGDDHSAHSELRGVAVVGGDEADADNSDAELVVRTRITAGGICCPAEVGLIHNILMPLPGVRDVEVQVVSKVVNVTHVPRLTSPGVLVAALNAAHLEASLGSRGPGESGSRLREKRWPPWWVVLCGLFMVLSLVSYGTDPQYLEYFKWLGIASVAVGIPPILLKAWRALRNWTLDINVLMTLAVAGAIALGDYVEASGIVFLFCLAEWLEDRCVARARVAISEVLTLQPATALVLPAAPGATIGGVDSGDKPTAAATGGDGVMAQDATPVLLEKVPVGSLVLVRPGDRIPLDGQVVQGNSAADEAMLTGETRLVPKRVGSDVFGGTVNMGLGTLVVRTSAAAGDSTVARLGALMEAAASQKSVRERAVEVFARWYTPAVVAAAAVIALVPSLVHQDDWQHWVYIALIVLVTACPCALVISTPVTSVCGLARAARQGVLVKGSLHLEMLGRVRTVTFDKSGTLTQGHFQVIHAEPLGPLAKPADASITAASEPGAAQAGLSRMLSLAASLEAHSSHPMAPAIIGYAAASTTYTGLDAGNVLAAPGLGLLGVVDGHEVALGSARLAINMLRSCRVSTRADSGSLSALSLATDSCTTSLGSDWDGKHVGSLGGGAAGSGAGKDANSSADGGKVTDAKRAQDAQALHERAAIQAAVDMWGTQGASVSFLIVDGVLAGVLAVKDVPRATAKEAVAALQARGVTCAMLTGDLTRTAAVVASSLGLDPSHVHAELLPADKLELVKLYRAGKERSFEPSTTVGNDARTGSTGPQAPRKAGKGGGIAIGGLRPVVWREEDEVDEEAGGGAAHTHTGAGKCEGPGHMSLEISSPADAVGGARQVSGRAAAGGARGWACWRRGEPPGVVLAHVGDGINDAPALAAADVGVAMGTSAAAIAVEAGDVVLFRSDLRSLAFAKDLGKRVTRVILANITFAMVVKIAVLVLAFTDYASLWISVLADVGSSLIVVLHALTVLGFQRHLAPRKAGKGKGKHAGGSGSASGDACCPAELHAARSAAAGGACAKQCCGAGSASSAQHVAPRKPCCGPGGCSASVSAPPAPAAAATKHACCSSSRCGASVAVQTAARDSIPLSTTGTKECCSAGSCSKTTPALPPAAPVKPCCSGKAACGSAPAPNTPAPAPACCASKRGACGAPAAAPACGAVLPAATTHTHSHAEHACGAHGTGHTHTDSHAHVVHGAHSKHSHGGDSHAGHAHTHAEGGAAKHVHAHVHAHTGCSHGDHAHSHDGPAHTHHHHAPSGPVEGTASVLATAAPPAAPAATVTKPACCSHVH